MVLSSLAAREDRAERRIIPNELWWQPPPTRTCSSWRVTATGPGSAPRAWAGPLGLSWIMPPVRCCSSGRTRPRTSAPCRHRHITLTLTGGERGNPDRQSEGGHGPIVAEGRSIVDLGNGIGDEDE